jgi:hypothetical protein
VPPAHLPAWGDPRKAFLHFQRLPGSGENYFVRAWAERRLDQPELVFDPESGQPWQSYDGTCVLIISGRRCEVVGILRIPERVIYSFRYRIAREFNIRTIWGERWPEDGVGGKRHVEINLPEILPIEARLSANANIGLQNRKAAAG